MEQEGMVHALEEIHRLLRIDGVLLEIHPVREPPIIEVRAGGAAMLAEPDPTYDYDDDIRNAEEAVAELVRRGLFAPEDEAPFGFLIHADSVRDLRDHFEISGAYDDTEREEAVTRREDAVYARAEAMMTDADVPTTIVYSERGHMNRLVRTEPGSAAR